MDHFGNPLLPPYTCLVEPPVSEDEMEVAVWDLARGCMGIEGRLSRL